MIRILLIILIGYLLGNFSTSFILGKIVEKRDIRKFGSGNAGATNALRVFGAKIAALTFLFDGFKGVLAVLIGNYLLGSDGALIAGISVIVGHNWPIILKFKGGKGIATSIGVVLTVNYLPALICIIIGLIIVIKTKYVSLGSVIAMMLLPVVGTLISRTFDRNFLIFTIIVSLLAIYRHKSNIKRLLEGNESKLGQRI